MVDKLLLLSCFTFVPCHPGSATGFWHTIKAPSGTNRHHLEVTSAAVVGLCVDQRYPLKPPVESVNPVSPRDALRVAKAASKKKGSVDVQGVVLTLSPIFRIPSQGGKLSFYFIMELGPPEDGSGGGGGGACESVTVVFQGEAEMAWYPFLSVGSELLITCLRSTVLDHGKPSSVHALRCTRSGSPREQSTAVMPPLGSGGGGAGTTQGNAAVSQLSQRLVQVGSLQGYTQKEGASQHDDKEVVDYRGVITEVMGDAIYELDSAVMVLCTHVALHGLGRGLRVGAEVHFCHVVPVMLRERFVCFGCGVFSSVRIVSFSPLDTPYRLMGREMSLFNNLWAQTSLPDFVQVRE